MGFTKITANTVATNNIALLDNRPNISSTELKERFDRVGVHIVDALGDITADVNTLIDELEKSSTTDPDFNNSGASKLGARPIWKGDNSGANVQAKLDMLKNYVDTITINAGTGDMLKAVYDPNDDGKVTAAGNADNADKLDGIEATGFAREIAGQTAKTDISDGDAFPLADSGASNAQKKTLWSSIKTALAVVFAKEINGQAQIYSIKNTDLIPVYDSYDATQKKVQWSTVKDIFIPRIVLINNSTATVSITIENNIEYQYSNSVASLTVAAPTGSFSSRILFTAAKDFVLTLPTGTRWAGGVKPTVAENDKCQLYLDQYGAALVPYRTVS